MSLLGKFNSLDVVSVRFRSFANYCGFSHWLPNYSSIIQTGNIS